MTGKKKSNKVELQVGALVWSADKNKVYLAKILNLQTTGSITKYFIHYQKWASKYDAWVDASNVAAENDIIGKSKLIKSDLNGNDGKINGKASKKRKDVEENEEIDATLNIDSDPVLTLQSSRGGKSIVIKDEDVGAARKKRKVLAQRDLTDEFDSNLPTAISLPSQLKKHLVDEWNLIANEPKHLLKIPRLVTVNDIFKEYLESKEKKIEKKVDYEKVKGLFEGLKVYFNKALPSILLYRHERIQYDILAESVFTTPKVAGVSSTSIPEVTILPSDIYGGEHLIRLFVRLPKLLSGVVMQTGNISDIVGEFNDFVKFIQKNANRYVNISDYIPVQEVLRILHENISIIVEEVKQKKTESIISRSKKSVKEEKNDIIVSPVSGRPMRPTAGKNRRLDD